MKQTLQLLPLSISRSHFFLLLILCVQIPIFSQVGVISGTVIDKDSKLKISDVFVNLNNTNNHSHTDAKGTFSFSAIPYGSYEMEFLINGYEKQLLIVQLSSEKLDLKVELASKSINLNTVPIAADKPVSAASSTYINQSGFINRPRNSAQDLLRLVPGLIIAQHAGGGKAEQIFIRGFDCDHGTDIATFVDGMPVNMPSHGHGQGYADLHFLIPETVEGMSVFKGTSSPLYGDFATGAAVSFKTMDSISNNLLQIESGTVPSTKSITSFRGLGLFKIPTNNQNVVSYFAIDALNNKGYFQINQDFKRMNVFSKTTIQLNPTNKIQFSFSGFGSSWNASGQIPERVVASGLISRFGSIDPNEGGTTQRNNFNFTHVAKVGNGELETQAYAFTYRFKLYSDFTFFLNDSILGDMIEQDDNRFAVGMNTKYSINHHLGKMRNKFTIGASFRSDDIENQLWKAPVRIRTSVTANAHIVQRSSSIFANEVFRFNEHFRTEYGLRYDYFIFDVEDKLPTDSTHNNYSGFNFQSALHPKLNLIYSCNDRLQFFFNTGTGFHSNDARSSVQDKNQHRLPLAVSSEFGTLFNIRKTVVSMALWAMDLSNELVYVGDDGTTENKGSSRRYGVDFSLRSQLSSWLFLDADVNFSRSRFTVNMLGTIEATNYYVPLAPVLTSVGGLTSKFKFGLECSLRYRFMMDRPANENNTVVAHGYNVFDFTANYKISRFKIGLSIENLLNVKWNEAQFATETRLKNENVPVEEIHFTPGTPFYAKLSLGFMF
jgi:outer membrane receptor for Fe3+-dicitrate